MSGIEILHLLLVGGAFGTTIFVGLNKCPVFIPLILISVDLLVRIFVKG